MTFHTLSSSGSVDLELVTVRAMTVLLLLELSAIPYSNNLTFFLALPTNYMPSWADYSLTGKTTSLLILPAKFCTCFHFFISPFSLPQFSFLLLGLVPRLINPQCLSLAVLTLDYCKHKDTGVRRPGYEAWPTSWWVLAVKNQWNGMVEWNTGMTFDTKNCLKAIKMTRS